MKLKSINLEKVYSFGNEGTRELTDFAQFNLFIGKNGSGKTSVFRAICELDIEQKYNPGKGKNSTELAFNTHFWGDNESIPNVPDIGWSPLNGQILRIEYDCNEVIEFKGGKHLRGDFESYKGTYIRHDDSERAFQKKTSRLKTDQKLCDILNFSFRYIFGIDISVGEKIFEKFVMNKDETEGYMGRNIVFDQWSSGYLAVLNILFDFHYGRIVTCIDEPELHLEPRVLRKLIDVLMWRCIPGERMEREWERWYESSTAINRDAWADSDKVNPLPIRQLFVASHSPVLIDEFLSRENCSIYEFNNERQRSRNPEPEKGTRGTDSLVSVVRKISFGHDAHSVLDNLGARGSDLLQTNGVIWVEGPSDVIYIEKWLEMYARENDLSEFKKSRNYQFQMYGGSLLARLCMFRDEECGIDEFRKLVDMFSINRNAYVVIDSDAEISENGAIRDNSFRDAKEYIEKQITKKNGKEGRNLGLWYEKDNIQITTIEDYTNEETDRGMTENKRKILKDKKKKKVENAKRRVNRWTERNSSSGKPIRLSDFNGKLGIQIQIMYEAIGRWNL